MLAGAVPVFAADARTAAALNLRSQPALDSRRLATLPPGARVEIGSCNAGWCEVYYLGQSGWAATRYLKIPERNWHPRVFEGGAQAGRQPARSYDGRNLGRRDPMRVPTLGGRQR
jgi:uncharacterized protein YraI